jgi:hypothetical protein
MRQELLEQLVLRGRQVNNTVAALRLPRLGIERKIREPQNWWSVGFLPAQEGVDAGEQHFKGERPDDVVIRSLRQATDLIGGSVFGRQHQHREVWVAGSKAGQHVIAVHARHHHVENHEIRVTGAGNGQALLSRSGNVECETLVRQTALQHTGYRRIVVDHGDTLHAYLPSSLEIVTLKEYGHDVSPPANGSPTQVSVIITAC